MIITQPDRVLLNKQVATLAPEMSGVLLDIGGGPGKRYKDMFTNVSKYMVLDIEEIYKPDIVGSVEEIPMDNESIDSILCTQVLEHVPHPTKALSEIFRILKPGGKALITVPQLNELHEEPRDFFRYTCFGLETLCKEQGFRVLKMDQRGQYASCMAQMRIRRYIDLLQPYQNKFSMIILCPLTLIYTKIALLIDTIDTTTSSKKHAIGWAVLLQK